MYVQFYGLVEKPFALVPDPRYLYLGSSHREALAHLLYGIEQGEGFIEVIGQVGTGKTTLCRTLVDQIGPNVDLAYIFNPSSSEAELLAAINREFGIPNTARSRAELVEELNRFLLERKAAGRRAVLVIDEAQNLDPDVLEQVRLLSNLETEREKLIQIVLIGQPELDQHLARADLRQLRQRITVRWSLHPFSAEETAAYLAHRLRVAGAREPELFARDAVRAIHRASRGVPRVINAIADRALLAAFSGGRKRIERSDVRRAVRELPGAEFERWHAVLGLRSGVAATLVALGLVGGLAWVGAGYVPRSLPAVDAARPAGAEPAAPPSEGAPEASDAWTAEDHAGTVAANASHVAPPTGVETALALLSANGSAARALDRVLDLWGYPRTGSDEIDPDLLSDAVRAISPLNVFATRVSRDQLVGVDLPAIVELELPGGEIRYAALVGLDAEGNARVGVGEASFDVRGPALDRLFTGRSFFVWTNFERLPAMSSGMNDPAVRWLQARLTDLGYLARGEASGLFDERTADAIRRFQTERQLRATGEVGPETLIALYQTLRYGAPRLALSPPGGDSVS
jgi:general secretion pathway protein A